MFEYLTSEMIKEVISNITQILKTNLFIIRKTNEELMWMKSNKIFVMCEII